MDRSKPDCCSIHETKLDRIFDAGCCRECRKAYRGSRAYIIDKLEELNSYRKSVATGTIHQQLHALEQKKLERKTLEAEEKRIYDLWDELIRAIGQVEWLVYTTQLQLVEDVNDETQEALYKALSDLQKKAEAFKAEYPEKNL